MTHSFNTRPPSAVNTGTDLRASGRPPCDRATEPAPARADPPAEETRGRRLLNRDAAALATRYAWREFPEELYDIVGPDGDRCFTHGRTRRRDENVEWVHLGKVTPDLVDGLVETGLGVPNANQMWIALHPRLGA